VPYLFLSIPVGALTERFDPRRMIQIGLLLFMSVSVTWAVLFLTDTLQMWHAMVLLTLHGVAGVLWAPVAQVLLHDIVPVELLPSAVRLNAMSRYLGFLLGPAIGNVLLLVFDAPLGLFLNALIYLPYFVWLWKAPYGPRFRPEPTSKVIRLGGIADVMIALRAIRARPTLLSMTLLAGGSALFIGNAYQAQMPGFAMDLGLGDPGVTYAMLLGADALGGLAAGLCLEYFGLLPPRARTALLLALLWAVALAGFALTSLYPLALLLLVAAGFLELSFNSMTTALVQLEAPAQMRGRIIGVFSTASLGLRTFSGVSVGLLGQAFGIHGSLAFSAGGVFLLASTLLAYAGRNAVASR
jgi:MFS family permease